MSEKTTLIFFCSFLVAICISLGILAASGFYPLPTWTNWPFHSSSLPPSTLLLSLIAGFASLKNNLSRKLPTLIETHSDLLRATGSSQMFINNGFNPKERAPGFYFFSVWSFPYSFGCGQLNKQGSCVFIILLREARCSVTSAAEISRNLPSSRSGRMALWWMVPWALSTPLSAVSLSPAHCMLLFILQNVWRFKSWDKTLKERQSWGKRNWSSRLACSWSCDKLVTESRVRHCTYLTLLSPHKTIGNRRILPTWNWGSSS